MGRILGDGPRGFGLERKGLSDRLGIGVLDFNNIYNYINNNILIIITTYNNNNILIHIIIIIYINTYIIL